MLRSRINVNAATARFAKKAPRKDGSGYVSIRIRPMNLEHAHYWDRRVQPAIRNAKPARADRLWNWKTLWATFPLALRLKGFNCIGWTVLMPNDAGDIVTAGMALLIEDYPHLPAGNPKEAVFTWFIAAAPDDVLMHLGVTAVPSLGQILVDTALTSSDVLGTQGRIGLHCASAGGSRLYNFYLKKCGLMPILPHEQLSISRRNDGRFFYSDEALSGILLLQMNGLRYP